MSISIEKKGVTRVKADCIVNAANSALAAGGGVCGAIFRKAGYTELTDACRKIGYCETGSAVITPAFALDARYIIHAVGPVWHGGHDGEEKLLKGCYVKSLELCSENGCSSIAFPLISSGIFGYPKEKAWKAALSACKEYLEKKCEDIDITFAVLDDEMLEMGNRILKEV